VRGAEWPSLPGAGGLFERSKFGAIAQLGERVLCKHDVVGSIPSGSTSLRSLIERRLSRRSPRGEGGLVAASFGFAGHDIIRVEEKKVPLRALLQRLTKLTS
jgi:hypothetical protein